MVSLYYLSHGGAGSGRYPWGSGERPYQRLEQPGKRRGILGYMRERKAKKMEKQELARRQKEIKKEMESAKSEAEREIEKRRALSKGTAADILTFQGELTNAEMREAIDRIKLENDLKSFLQSDIDRAFKKAEKFSSKVKVTGDLLSNGINLYNNLAAIYNTGAKDADKMKIVNRGGGGK